MHFIISVNAFTRFSLKSSLRCWNVVIVKLDARAHPRGKLNPLSISIQLSKIRYNTRRQSFGGINSCTRSPCSRQMDHCFMCIYIPSPIQNKPSVHVVVTILMEKGNKIRTLVTTNAISYNISSSILTTRHKYLSCH